MGKHEQQPDPEKDYLKFKGGERLEINPENTAIFMHSDEFKMYDHIFYFHDTTGEEEETGLVFFREVVDKFDEFTKTLSDKGYKVIRTEGPTNNDMEMYQGFFGKLPDIDIKTFPLNSRQEKLIKKFGETVLAMPDDLLYDELTMEHNKPHPERWAE